MTCTLLKKGMNNDTLISSSRKNLHFNSLVLILIFNNPSICFCFFKLYYSTLLFQVFFLFFLDACLNFRANACACMFSEKGLTCCS
jgi:hypothetical protein